MHRWIKGLAADRLGRGEVRFWEGSYGLPEAGQELGEPVGPLAGVS